MMKLRFSLLVGFLPLTLGLVFNFAPRNWFETIFGLRPDSGSGAAEFLASFLLVGAGVLPVLRVLKPSIPLISDRVR